MADGDAVLQALLEALGPGSLPSLLELSLYDSQIGPASAEALAFAIRRGKLPKLVRLDLRNNPLLGSQGVAVLAPALRMQPALEDLDLAFCAIDDEGVGSLLAGLGKDDFKALTTLELEGNLLTDVGCAKLVAALNAGAMPNVTSLYSIEQAALISEDASEEACAAVDAALDARRRSRAAEAALH